MKSYTIHFIRHGMTEANINGQYAGSWDIPICEEGKKKLKELKENFEYPNVKEYYSSPLSRCLQTCDIIYPEAKINIIDGLKEWDFGDWEGKTTEELMKDERYVKWIESGRATSTPNGESGKDFGMRVCKSVEEIIHSLVTRGVDSAAIFTHGGVIMSILATYGFPRAEFLDWIVDNGCGYSVRITPSLWMRDKIFEVYDKVPEGSNNKIEGKFKDLIDNLK